MKVLVINCGSTTLKYQLIDSISEEVLAKGICERIGIDGSFIKHEAEGKEAVKYCFEMPNHKQAVALVLKELVGEKAGVIADLNEISVVGHRVVHGGEKFAQATVITDEVLAQIDECSALAPLHNPANLIGIKACQELMKEVPMVAVFDTAFHQTIPAKAYMYGIPYEYYTKYAIRRYGFHGTSHSYVSKRAAEILGIDYDKANIIVCHLGGGSSICAVQNGKSVDTSMGMTPLEGVCMGTRSGCIDPTIIEFLMKQEDLTIDQVMTILNKKSGVETLSGVSSDFRDIEKAAAEGNERAILAQDVFSYQVAKYIGSYALTMGRVDAVVFTAGVGENDSVIRRKISEQLGLLGATIDLEKNKVRAVETIISTDDSKTKIMLVPTNEELAIARESIAFVK